MIDQDPRPGRAVLKAQVEAAARAAAQYEAVNELEPAAPWHALAAFNRAVERCLNTAPLDLDALGVQVGITALEACFRRASEEPSREEILAADIEESAFVAARYESLAVAASDPEPKWAALATFHRAVEACLRVGVDLDALFNQLFSIDKTSARALGFEPMTRKEQCKWWS